MCGIYRLSVVEGPLKGETYIGQAVNIGDRWMQHGKKFKGVGVENRGGEKLYEVERPDDIRWEVVEVVDREKLNERES